MKECFTLVIGKENYDGTSLCKVEVIGTPKLRDCI